MGLLRRLVRGRGRRRRGRVSYKRWYHDVYLHSEHWRRRRLRALQRAHFRCERCGRRHRPGRDGALQVHHLSYARLGHERDRDLEVLCDHDHRAAEGLPA